jgi:hypothetical protein
MVNDLNKGFLSSWENLFAQYFGEKHGADLFQVCGVALNNLDMFKGCLL